MHNNTFNISAKRFLFYFALLAAFAIVILTQSRGAIIAIMLGLFILIFYAQVRISRKVILVAMIAIVTTIGYSQLEKSSGFMERLKLLVSEGDDSRMDIYEDVASFIDNVPPWGIGENGYYNEIVKVRREYSATHNGFLDVYITSGIIGLLLFIYFIIRIGRMAFSDAKKNNMVIPLILYIMILFNFAKAGGGWTSKIFWIVMAIAVASYNIGLKGYIPQNKE